MEREPLVKSQTVRLLDIFVFGPVIIYAATKIPKKHKVLRGTMGVISVGTMAYNAHNYMQVERYKRLTRR